MEPSIYALFLVVGFVLGRWSVSVGRGRATDYDIIQNSYLEDISDERLTMEEFDKRREIVR